MPFNTLSPDLLRCLCFHVSAKTFYALTHSSRQISVSLLTDKHQHLMINQLSRSIVTSVSSETYLPNGSKHGKSERFDSDSKIVSFRYNYMNGILDGMQEEWYPDGTPRCLSSWKNGVRQGIAQIWGSNGQLAEQHTFHNDKLHGLSYYYYTNGSLSRRTTYQDGHIHAITEEFYGANGSSSERYYYWQSILVSSWWFTAMQYLEGAYNKLPIFSW